MLQPIYHHRFSMPMRTFVAVVLSAFVTVTIPPVPAFAQSSLLLYPTSVYHPMTIKGIQLVPGNPLRFDFMIDKGNSGLQNAALREESTKLVKYFLTALTIPEGDLWVNLSPYQRDIIIAESFGKTQMGKIFLEQDYTLKRMTASLTYPERPIGQQFWSRVHQKAQQLYGTADIPVNAFNKVWIVPKTADVISYKDGAIIINSQLDVMVDSDYLAQKKNKTDQLNNTESPTNSSSEGDTKLYTEILKTVIIPELRREVNEGKSFAPLRQIYQAMILAVWYKRHLRNSVLSRIYVRQQKVDGVNSDDPAIKEKVYSQYLETIQKGIYNYIREDKDALTNEIIPRKYMSGGLEFSLLGQGGPNDKYRELGPEAAYRANFQDGPVIAEADLELLTANGGKAALPVIAQTPQRTGPSSSWRWLKRLLLSTSVLALLSLYPSQVWGAQFTQATNGEIIVQVESNDSYGQIVLDMQNAYRSTNYAEYKRSQLFGNLWGREGVVERLSNGHDYGQIKPGQRLSFERTLLPQQAVDKLIKRVETDVQAPEVALSVPITKEPEPAKPTQYINEAQATINQEPGLLFDLLGTLAGFGFIWGVAQFFKTGKRTNIRQKDNRHKISRAKIAAKISEGFKGGLRILTDNDSSPRLDDAEQNQERPKTIFAEEHRPSASAEEELAWSQEQAAQGARAFSKTPASLMPIDVFGWILGVGLTGITSDWNLSSVALSAVIMPFITRAVLSIQLFIHEFVGHFIPALILSPERSSVLSLPNFMGNLSWRDWARLMLPGTDLSSEARNPGVDIWSSGWRKTAINVSGFVTTLGVSILAGMESMHIWMPLIGPLGVSSLAVLAGSYATDIRGDKTFTDTLDDGCGRSECGIFGALWTDDSSEIYPSWVRDGFSRLVNALIIRGGQSAGEFAIGMKTSVGTLDNKGGQEVVPVLSKVLKYKRGGGLTETLDQEFSRLVDVMRKKKVTAAEGVKGILGHVRFATGGKVTREASHPHIGIQEVHDVWKLDSGRWAKGPVNVFVAIGHNGDNDIWKIWGLRLNTSQMRELFPAVFRMNKTFKVFIKSKDPKTGKEIKDIQYEALPPGDSPPLALQIHYLLTQGDWVASARFAYTENLLRSLDSNLDYTEEELASMSRLKLRQALPKLLTKDDENKLAEVFEAVFKAHEEALLRPRLKTANKSFADLWVTPQIVSEHPSLRYQLDALNAFRLDLAKTFTKHIQTNTEVGEILKRMETIDKDILRKFVYSAVEKFFTGNREAAVKEFAGRSEGTYGVAVRTSKEPNGVTLYSSDQGVTIGYNQKERLVTFSSEHSTLQYAFGEKGHMDDLVFINPEQPGQMADVNLSDDLSDPHPITIKVYSFGLKRTMKPQEIAQQQFPQDHNNPYWSPQISYKDPQNIVMSDIAVIPKEVRAARQSWSNKESFNRLSADALLKKMVSRYLETYIKENSEFYGAAKGNLTAQLFSKSTECLVGAGCDIQEANRRSAILSNRLQADGRVTDYLKSRIDWVVGRLADQLAEDFTSGKLSETDMVVKFRRQIDGRLRSLMDQEIASVVDAVIKGNLHQLIGWKEWENNEGEIRLSETEVKQDNDSADKELSDQQSLGLIGRIAAKFMGSNITDRDRSDSEHGRSLDSGETDLLIAGYEDSLWFGENMVSMMKTIFPKMHVWATSANKAFNLNGDHKIGRRTLSMIISKSGATFPSRGIVRRLRQLSPDNTFAMTARVDTLVAMALGQKFQPQAPFINRIFVTGNYYPSEANSVGEVMLFAHQIELVLYLAEGMQRIFPEQKPWGLNMTSEDLAKLKELRNQMYDEARRLTGRDENGHEINGTYIRSMIDTKLNGDQLTIPIDHALSELKRLERRADAEDLRHLVSRVLQDNSSSTDHEFQSMLLLLWKDIESAGSWAAPVQRLLNSSGGDIRKINNQSIHELINDIFIRPMADKSDVLSSAYLEPTQTLKENAHALGKTMTETGIITIIYRIFVMSIFWFGAPIENIFLLFGIHFGPTFQDWGGMFVRTFDGILALFAPWLMTTLVFRAWSGRPQWSRMGPPTVTIGDPITALHQTAEGFWSKLGAVAFGSMSMNIHGANPDDHFVARLAHRVVRGTIAIFGVPAEPSHKENVIVSMKQTKAIINGAVLDFLKGGAQIFSIGRGELDNPDVTDHHMDIGKQYLEGSSKLVQDFNFYAFDAFGRHMAYKILFAQAYDWATRWEPKLLFFGKKFSLKSFYLWNPAWSYSRTGVHTTRSPKGGSTEELPDYLDPAQDISFGSGAWYENSGSSPENLDETSSPATSEELRITPVESHGSAAVPMITTPDASSSAAAPGGIDLGTQWLNMRVTGGEVNIFLNDENIEFIPIRGIVPRIIDIRPMTIDHLLTSMERTPLMDRVTQNSFDNTIRYSYRKIDDEANL